MGHSELPEGAVGIEEKECDSPILTSEDIAKLRRRCEFVGLSDSAEMESGMFFLLGGRLMTTLHQSSNGIQRQRGRIEGNAKLVHNGPNSHGNPHTLASIQSVRSSEAGLLDSDQAEGVHTARSRKIGSKERQCSLIDDLQVTRVGCATLDVSPVKSRVAGWPAVNPGGGNEGLHAIVSH